MLHFSFGAGPCHPNKDAQESRESQEGKNVCNESLSHESLFNSSLGENEGISDKTCQEIQKSHQHPKKRIA